MDLYCTGTACDAFGFVQAMRFVTRMKDTPRSATFGRMDTAPSEAAQDEGQ